MSLWFCQRDGRTGKIKKRNLDILPSYTVAAGGIGDAFAGGYWIEDNTLSLSLSEKMKSETKSPYKVPSMAEIAAIPKNKYSVISTFSGVGGSCLGYRMARFKILWANEIEPNAVECYRLNFPGTILDMRSIRSITFGEILRAIKKRPGQIDLLDGSPPCQSFSTAGKRQKGWGRSEMHGDGTTGRSDDLFFEFARLLKGLQPKTFIAENVSGLVKGVAKGYFKEILAALKSCGYVVEARLLDAQWLGVPQARQRIIFVGVRDDLTEKFGVKPVFPKPLSYRYSITDAIADLLEKSERPERPERPSPTITAHQCADTGFNPPPRIIHAHGGALTKDVNHSSAHKPSATIRTTDQAQHAIVTPAFSPWMADEYERLKPGETSKLHFNMRRPSPARPSPTIAASHGGKGIASVVHPSERRKFSIAELKRICSFPDDFRLVGSYAKQWARLGNSVPPLMAAAVARAIKEGILDKIPR